jgi:hypothetical protein
VRTGYSDSYSTYPDNRCAYDNFPVIQNSNYNNNADGYFPATLPDRMPARIPASRPAPFSRYGPAGSSARRRSKNYNGEHSLERALCAIVELCPTAPTSPDSALYNRCPVCFQLDTSLLRRIRRSSPIRTWDANFGRVSNTLGGQCWFGWR